MAIRVMRCVVLGAKVICLTGLNGATSVVCSAHERSTATCRLKSGASRGGPLSQLLERAYGSASKSSDRACHLCGPQPYRYKP
jgi:hypothetical protein